MTHRRSGLRRWISGVCAAPTIILTVLAASGHAGKQDAITGALDPSFGIGGTVTVPMAGTLSGGAALLLQSDGKLVAGAESERDFGLVRLLPDGGLDDDFGVGGRVVTNFGGGDFDRVNSLVQLPDGALIAAGMARGNPGGADFGLARYLPDGTLDPAFGAGGIVTTDFNAYYESAAAVLLQPDGKLVAVGGPAFLLARYHPNGSLDATFGAGGKVVSVVEGGAVATAGVLQPDGRVVVAGTIGLNDFLLVRYQPDGSIDASFGTQGRVITDFGGSEWVTAVALQPDNKLVAVGGPSPSSGPSVGTDFLLARYNADGSLDQTFGASGKVRTDFFLGAADRAQAVIVQPDGRIVVGGGALAGPGSPERFGLARYHADGSLDETFGSAGKVITEFGANSASLTALALYPDGRVAAAGPGLALARYGSGDATCVVNTLAALQHAPAPMAGLARPSSIDSGGAYDVPVPRKSVPALDPSVFRRFRDEVLARSGTGRRYAGLYAAHSPEVVRLMLADASLRGAILDGLLQWQPHLAALRGSRSAELKVTTDQSRLVDAVLDRLAAVGSPSLRRAVETERRGQRRGVTFSQELLREVTR